MPKPTQAEVAGESMKLDELPLPKPEFSADDTGFGVAYSPEQMRAAMRAGALAALDEAIKECEQRQQKALSVQSDARGNIAHEQANVHLRMMAMYANDCATAIRRLRDTIAKGESE